MKQSEKNSTVKKKLADIIKRGTFKEGQKQEEELLEQLRRDSKILKINKGNIWDRNRLQKARKGYQNKTDAARLKKQEEALGIHVIV